MLTIGRFTLSDEDVLEGPADYMIEQGNATVDRIMAGDDLSFNICRDQSPDIRTALLVRLQNDYAGWAGVQPFLHTNGAP